ncbi:MAG: asparagine synthase B [Eubacterium sp.]|nr:asparagine synthase B [Eubacterium sp.]
MCTILAMERKTVPLEKVKANLRLTHSRGPDDERVISVGGGWMGFQRLAIMGLTKEGMQPFNLGADYLACNGEVYGFRPQRVDMIARGYKFRSTSDCEILLPLYQEFGTEMFSMLDSEFALVIYDGEKRKWIAARDPIGIRPLFYGNAADGSYVFGSEPKLMQGLVEGKIYPFPPGCYYEDGKFIRYCDPAFDPASYTETQFPEETEAKILNGGEQDRMIHATPDEASDKIRELLVKAVAKRMDADMPVGFLLSGGLDSSLVCAIAARLTDKRIRTYAIGMDINPIDLKYAKETAKYLNADHTEVIMTKEDVLENLRELIHLLGTWDITTIRASMGMYLCCKYIHENSDIRVLLTGEVSDEIFGYKYTDFAPSPEEFQKEAEKRVRELHYYDVLRADRCISVNSLEARVPFGDLDFIKYVMRLDPKIKVNSYGKGKYLLRHAFEKGEWLPDSILWREKAAFSDAVGHSMVDDLKAYAEQFYTDEEFREKCAKYPEPKPFTKESLLYREIFEEFYPGQDQMIPTYWMPNKTWPGCNVDDPSARVLSNYGASGD